MYKLKIRWQADQWDTDVRNFIKTAPRNEGDPHGIKYKSFLETVNYGVNSYFRFMIERWLGDDIADYLMENTKNLRISNFVCYDALTVSHFIIVTLFVDEEMASYIKLSSARNLNIKKHQ